MNLYMLVLVAIACFIWEFYSTITQH